MPTGKIKNVPGSFGFIEPNIHFWLSDTVDGYQPEPGDEVSYEAGQGPKGPKATKVKLIKKAEKSGADKPDKPPPAKPVEKKPDRAIKAEGSCFPNEHDEHLVYVTVYKNGKPVLDSYQIMDLSSTPGLDISFTRHKKEKFELLQIKFNAALASQARIKFRYGSAEVTRVLLKKSPVLPATPTGAQS